MRRIALVGLILVPCIPAAGAIGAAPPKQNRPNILVIETDDQTQASLAYMPKTRALLAAQGVTFENSFATFALCCPSRATFLTGQYAHTNGVLGNRPPSGGYEVFRQKYATNNLAVWLQRAGYHTALVGKFLNGYGRGDGAEVPRGWSEWHGGVDLSVLGGTMNDNGRVHTLPATEAYYQTDVFSRTAQEIIRRRAPSSQPFFIWLTPHVPHTAGPRDDDDPPGVGTTRPPERYKNRFSELSLPSPPSFNEADVSDKPAGIRNRPPLSAEQTTGLREAYQQALEANLGVDDLVASVVAKLRAAGELANTVIIYTSDNGFFYGEHRVPQGKVLLYEPSIRVPLLVRGPGVPKNVRLQQLAGNIDLAPTILEAAHAKAGLSMDGRSLYALFRNPKLTWTRALVIERGPAAGGPRRRRGVRDQTFVALRTPQYKYAQYGSGEEELYDLARDPHELESRHADPAYASIRATLAARLTRLRNCAGAVCWTR